MKTNFNAFLVIIFPMLLIMTLSCEENPLIVFLPNTTPTILTLTTTTISDISDVNRVIVGDIIIDEGAEVRARGVCWDCGSNRIASILR